MQQCVVFDNLLQLKKQTLLIEYATNYRYVSSAFVNCFILIQHQECSFYEVEVVGEGNKVECRPIEHSSHTVEVAMMASSCTVGVLACLLRLVFSKQYKTQRRSGHLQDSHT